MLIVATSLLPSFSFAFQQQTPSPEEMDAFYWLKDNTPENSTILVTLTEGHLLNYVSERKNLMDGEFGLIKNIEERFKHMNSLYVTKYQTQAVNILDRYDIRYLLFSPQAKEEYQIEEFAYLDETCFELVTDHCEVADASNLGKRQNPMSFSDFYRHYGID